MWMVRWSVCCGLLWFGMGAAWAKRPCIELSKKVCGVVGKKAFVCMTYKTVARHSQVDQKRCQRLLKENWTKREQSLKRSEATLRKMDALGSRSGPMGQRKVREYKKAWALCTAARMLKNAPAEPLPCKQLAQMSGKKASQPLNKMACQKLRLLACRDLGATSFYCRLFTHIINKSKRIKLDKCQTIVNLWGNSQLPYYRKREAALQAMAQMVKKSKNPQMAKKFNDIRKKEMLSVYMFLHK